MSSRIDWQAARERLAHTSAALDKARSPDPEFVQEVFRKRAERLANPQEQSRHPESEIQTLMFLVGDEKYAIDIIQISEIVTRPACTPVPGAPAKLLGVMQVRGEICPLWSLAHLVGITGAAPGAALVLRIPGRPLGAVGVTAVLDINVFRRELFVPYDGKRQIVKGIGPGLVSLLNTEEIMKEAVR